MAKTPYANIESASWQQTMLLREHHTRDAPERFAIRAEDLSAQAAWSRSTQSRLAAA